jgi:hypothetical protein
MRSELFSRRSRQWFRLINRFIQMKRLTNPVAAGNLRPSIETG